MQKISSIDSILIDLKDEIKNPPKRVDFDQNRVSLKPTLLSYENQSPLSIVGGRGQYSVNINYNKLIFKNMQWSDNDQREQIKFLLGQVKNRTNVIIVLLILIIILFGIAVF